MSTNEVKHLLYHSSLQRRVLSVFFLILIVVLTLDNLRAWGVAGATNPASVVFDGIGYRQMGWGMYSFDLRSVSALKVRYESPDNGSITVPSAYGFIPSFKRTPLGNFDPFVTSDSSYNLANSYASYLCKHPEAAIKNPSKLSIIRTSSDVPSLNSKAHPFFNDSTDTVLSEVTCQKK